MTTPQEEKKIYTNILKALSVSTLVHHNLFKNYDGENNIWYGTQPDIVKGNPKIFKH